MAAEKQVIKKVWQQMSQEVEMPQGVSCKYEDFALIVTGPKGEVAKKLKFPNVVIEVTDKSVVIKTERLTKREKKIIMTYVAHVNNLITGVTEGFQYDLVVVYSKFPMTVELKGDVLNVKNLLGEKVPRSVKIPSDVKVDVKGANITVTGIDKEKTGQVAANIEQSCRITHLDRRVIQDGIYITKKPHREY